jgi:hypothetical protein
MQHHALSNRYLKTMSLCVTDKDKEHALEEYIFDVEYDEGDTATISVGAQQGSGTRAHMPQRLTADSKLKEAGCTMVSSCGSTYCIDTFLREQAVIPT